MNKKTLLGLVALVAVGLLFLVGSSPSSAPVVENSVGGVSQEIDFYVNGVGFGPDFATFSQSGTIGSGRNSGSWENKTGRTVYVDLSTMTTTGTASSSSIVYGYASSTLPSTTYDFTAPASANRMTIGAFSIATSSVATTTSSIEKAPAGKVISVPDGWYLIFLLRQDTTNASIACAAAGLCETATSTNRGFNVDWYFRGFFKP